MNPLLVFRAKDELDPLDKLLKDKKFWAEYRKQLETAITPLAIDIFTSGVDAATRQLEKPKKKAEAAIPLPDLTPEGEIEEATMRAYTSRLTDTVFGTTYDGVKDAIIRARRDGTGLEGALKSVRTLFSPARAEMIAVTETTRLFGAGAVAKYQSLGATHWTWQTVNDPWVEDQCNALQGKQFKIDEPFDPKHPRCRCFPRALRADIGEEPTASAEAIDSRVNVTDWVKESNDRYWKYWEKESAEAADTSWMKIVPAGKDMDWVRARLDAQLPDIIARASVYMRITPTSLSKVLKEGRWKTFVETGRSGAGGKKAEYREERLKYEKDTFGPDSHPVYGYLAETSTHATRSTFNLDAYGEITVKFKDPIRAASTWTASDSLDVGRARYTDAEGDVYGLAPSPVLKPSSGSMPAHLKVVDEDGSLTFDSVDSVKSPYVEAQIHYTPAVTDIERVYLRSEPSAALAKALEKAGVPWEITG